MQFGNFGYVDEITGAGWSEAWKKAQAKGAPEDQRPYYHWHQYDPGVVPNLLFTGNGSPTGITFYEGKLLPSAFRNQIIHCDAGPRVVRAYITTPNGAGYKAEIRDILTTTNTWFRPSDVCAAPDGALYVADWNDAGVGGHYMADQKLETMTGRIYRVAPKGHKPAAPAYDFSAARGAANALQSPNQAVRYLAWTKLHELQGKAERDLMRLWRGSDQTQRARALHLLSQVKGREKKSIENGLKDKNSDIRIAALRIVQAQKMDVIPYVKMLVKDASPQVRRECALALRHSKAPEAAGLWAALAQQYDGNDRWYLEALGIGADQQWDACLGAWLSQVGDNWNTPAGREIIWRSRSAKTPPLLVKLINDKSSSAKDRERYFRSLDFIRGPEKDKAVVDLLTTATSTN
jgi:hypothetical protein